jgi:hypothetical protein
MLPMAASSMQDTHVRWPGPLVHDGADEHHPFGSTYSGAGAEACSCPVSAPTVARTRPPPPPRPLLALMNVPPPHRPQIH